MDDKVRFVSPEETAEIDQKVNFELNEMQFKMIKVGGIANIVSGLLVIWILKGQVQNTLLMGWFVALVFSNFINILFSYAFKYFQVTPKNIKPWKAIHHVILIFVCLAWGAMGLFFTDGNIQQQLYIIAFLLAVLVGFAVGTISDFVAAVISIICILGPFVISHFWRGIQSILTTGADPHLYLAFSIVMTILGTFLLVTAFIGNRLIKRSYRLTYENIALNQKLENMNALLEQRVKERTLELEKSLRLVTYQASHDLLTDLPNQRLLLKYAQKAIKSAFEKKRMFALISFSLNELEKINDGLGHHIGDLVMRAIAERFKNNFKIKIGVEEEHRYIVTLSRKDVFVILLEPIFQLDEIDAHAKFLFSILDEPIQLEKQILKLTASIGVSIYPRDGKNVKTLLMNSDAALLQAKQQGGNHYNIYKTEINADISRQLALESNLHTAIVNSEFLLQYQPFVDIKSGKICGAEALVRWNHPALGFIPPDHFIPLAEANGIINPLGEWVLRTACMQTKIWHDLGFSSLKVAINLSAKQLQQKNIVAMIDHILKEMHLDAHFIEFELTETEAFNAEVIPVIKQFKNLGIGLSIDDFGTGYSGLTNLKLLDIDKLKIDKSFVQDLMINDDSRVIVANTIALAKKIEVQVLAEGVETREQLQFLKENGCDLIQGYYFSKPVYPEVFTELLQSEPKFVI